MSFLADIPLGRFEPGDSPLHRLDPRVKLLLLPALVMGVFAARSPGQLTALALLAFGVAWLGKGPGRVLWRGAWALRHLLLFTLLLHLFLSPGRTLFGLQWLSMDGLLQGGLVCGQLLLALVFSSLLTLTSSPEDLARAFQSLLSPLRRLGLPVGEWSGLLFLVLRFIPILREEALALREKEGRGTEPRSRGFWGRAREARLLLGPLLAALVARADAMARLLARGEDPLGEARGAASPLGLRKVDLLALVAGAACLILILGGMP